MCCLEAPGPVLNGAGKRPFDVAEQLAFQQTLAERAAIDSNIGPAARGLSS